MPRFLLALCLGVAAAIGASPLRAQQTLLGVYYGNQGWAMDQVRAMEAWQGKRHAVVNLFTDWCNRTKNLDNLFKQQLPAIWSNGNVPMITWEPYLCSSSATPADVEVRAARGDYDAYVNVWADRLKMFLAGADGVYGTADDRRAYLRLAHEMNGDWYPWGAAMGGNSPLDHQNMWRRVRGIFTAKGIDPTRLQWVWAVNHVDVGTWGAEQYFPGEAYVDWLAIDGYNWGASQSWSSWQTPDQVFGPMLARLRALTGGRLPVAVTETASSTLTATGASLAAKSAWIGDFFAYVAANAIRMSVWFDEDKETDWAVFGGAYGDETFKSGRTTYKAYRAYRTGVAGAAFVGSNPADPRLVTDAAFAGR